MVGCEERRNRRELGDPERAVLVEELSNRVPAGRLEVTRRTARTSRAACITRSLRKLFPVEDIET